MSKLPNHFKHFKAHLRKSLALKLLVLLFFALLLFVLAPFLIIPFIDVKPAKDITYGVTFSPPYAESLGMDWKKMYISILDELNVDNFRLVSYWNRIEKEEGKYDFSELDWQIEEAGKRDADVILSIGLKVPRWPECHEPGWAKGLSKGEKERYVLKLLSEQVEHFKKYDNIKMWQVENEPYFPFGECTPPRWEFIKSEVDLVKKLDPSRPIIIQDSGEGGFWFPTYSLGDYLGISMYRRIWYDFWGIFLGEHVFFTYPLAYWSYPLKAWAVGVPLDRIKVLELQAEPWGDGPIDKVTQEVKDKTLSKDKFLETISYAQKTGIDTFYFWGAEWWYWEKETNNEPFFWETAKAFWK